MLPATSVSRSFVFYFFVFQFPLHLPVTKCPISPICISLYLTTSNIKSPLSYVFQSQLHPFPSSLLPVFASLPTTTVKILHFPALKFLLPTFSVPLFILPHLSYFQFRSFSLPPLTSFFHSHSPFSFSPHPLLTFSQISLPPVFHALCFPLLLYSVSVSLIFHAPASDSPV